MILISDEVGNNSNWFSVADLPRRVADGSACVIGDKLYHFGGYDKNVEDIPWTFRYDPEFNEWNKCDDMPVAVQQELAIAHKGKAYLFGGCKDGNPLDNLWIFDPSKPLGNQWSTGAKMPYKLRGHMGVYSSSDGLIHIVGGVTGNGPFLNKVTQNVFGLNILGSFVNHHFTYNPERDTYDTGVADKPTRCAWGTACELNGKIYVIGGKSISIGSGTDLNEVYDVKTDTWFSRAPHPWKHWGSARSVRPIDGKIYVTHGFNSEVFENRIDSYNPVNNSWERLGDGFHPRDGVAAGILKENLYIVGGRNKNPSQGGLKFAEVYRPR